MDEITNEDLQVLLDEAVNEASERDSIGLHYVSSALKSRETGGEDDPISALRVGLDYHFQARGEDREDGRPFGPMFEFDDVSYPMPVEELPTEVLALWARAIDLSPIASVSARYADLLWEARFGDEPYRWCVEAIESYVRAMEEGFGHVVETMQMGRRALELVRMTNDTERLPVVVEAIEQVIRQSLEEGGSPGVALPLLETLIALPKADRPESVGPLVDKTIDVYGDDPWHLESALNLKARLTAADDRAVLHQAQVDAFLALADRSSGLVRYSHLQHALELATQHDLEEAATEIRRTIESMTEDEFDLKVVSSEVKIPREEIDNDVSRVVGEDDLPSALSRFGSYMPIKEREETLELVDELMAEYPLQSLFTRMTIGPENTLLRQAAGPDEHREAQLIDYETRTISFFALLAVEILDAIRERYGPIGGQPNLFESFLIDSPTAERIAAAVASYEAEDYDGAGSVITPRLERSIREMARAVAVPITGSLTNRGVTSGVRGLGKLLHEMKGRVPEVIRRYLVLLLAEPTSLNLRNLISHGLVDAVAEPQAALLIHTACVLRLLEPQAEG